ncbi:MAG: NAD-dependent deacylase [Ignavibacterium sp.]|nr:NAD-dependent deacylase [Ignavibacterium sp.]MCX7610702.1 NAD-dependent deacylase [Ignavibacterium sp.]MDW8375494.1 NAD-dependent deacylase [Ignavibacteriales bacterium]
MIEIPSKLIDKLQTSEKIVFFTGAGISAESGIPTFRGEDGIWNKLSPEELANFNAFMKNPKMVWEWYQYRRKITHNSQPNAGHLAIVEFEKYFPEVTVITQNVDNLHRRAGSKIIYELHGNIEKNYCIKCKKRYDEDLNFEDGIPKCECGGLIRPDVVWFGEYLPVDQLRKSEEATISSDIFFVIGTSAVVYPAAGLVYTARQYGSFIVEINIDSTEVSKICDVTFQGKAGEVLPKILDEVRKIKS